MWGVAICVHTVQPWNTSSLYLHGVGSERGVVYQKIEAVCSCQQRCCSVAHFLQQASAFTAGLSFLQQASAFYSRPQLYLNVNTTSLPPPHPFNLPSILSVCFFIGSHFFYMCNCSPNVLPFKSSSTALSFLFITCIPLSLSAPPPETPSAGGGAGGVQVVPPCFAPLIDHVLSTAA